MALYTELPVYRDTYQLILRIFEFTREFSKEYKYTLGQDMKREVLSRNFFQIQCGETLGDFMPQVHKTVQRWIGFLPSDAVLFEAYGGVQFQPV